MLMLLGRCKAPFIEPTRTLRLRRHKNTTTGTRFDFGVKWTTRLGTEVEISMPLRIDEGVIIPITGININFSKDIY